MGEVSREEVNGMGKRLNELEKSLAGCQGRSAERARASELRDTQTQASINTIFAKFDEMQKRMDARFESLTKQVSEIGKGLAVVVAKFGWIVLAVTTLISGIPAIIKFFG